MRIRSAAIVLGALALGTASASADVPPGIVHVNQLGFEPDSAKRAILSDPATKPLPWTIFDAKGGIVTKGSTTVMGDDAASGDHVHVVDFSQVTTPGKYRLQAGDNVSNAFPIARGIYAPLKYAALNYFYQTRAGIPIEARFAGGPQWARPAGHPKEVAPCFSSKDDRGNAWPGCDYSLDVTGGWYDAGDHGK